MLSPNKTVGGLLGNALGALLAVIVLLPTLPELGPAGVILLTFVISFGAVWGDLFSSALKREAGVKDAGSWLPGFGGLLDRIDSLVLAVPLVYYTVVLAGLLSQTEARA
jgi:phosphatidate cytidylyltransferase